jgi:hypothetical protein
MNKVLRVFIPIKISIITLAFSCNQEGKVNNANNCQKDFYSANANLNLYYKDSSRNHLDSTLFYIDRSSSSCPEFKTRFVNLKLSVLILLKDGKKGHDFVSSLDSNDFYKVYTKNLYLRNFDAISYEKQGDTTKRNQEYSKLSSIIEKYLQKNPTDKEAYMDLFYTNVKLKGKAQVIREIDSLYKNRINDNNFVELVKKSIKSLPE